MLKKKKKNPVYHSLRMFWTYLKRQQSREIVFKFHDHDTQNFLMNIYQDRHIQSWGKQGMQSSSHIKYVQNYLTHLFTFPLVWLSIDHSHSNKIFSFQVWLPFNAFVILQIRWATEIKDSICCSYIKTKSPFL